MEVYGRNPQSILCYDKWLFDCINILRPEQKPVWGQVCFVFELVVVGWVKNGKEEIGIKVKPQISRGQYIICKLKIIKSYIKYLCSCHSPGSNKSFTKNSLVHQDSCIIVLISIKEFLQASPFATIFEWHFIPQPRKLMFVSLMLCKYTIHYKLQLTPKGSFSKTTVK